MGFVGGTEGLRDGGRGSSACEGLAAGEKMACWGSVSHPVRESAGVRGFRGQHRSNHE